MRFTTVYATGMLSSETAVYVCLGLKKENASAADSHVRNYLLVCRIYSAAVVFLDAVPWAVMGLLLLESADQLLRLQIQLLEFIDLLADHLLDYSGQLIS